MQGFPDYSPPKFVLDALSEASQQPMLQQYTRGPVRLIQYCYRRIIILEIVWV